HLSQVQTDYQDASIIDGVSYIFSKATAAGMPAVVNLSLGSQYGPHDGSDPFSFAVGGLTGAGHIVVASAGNDNNLKEHGKLTTTSSTVGTDKFTFSIPSYSPRADIFNDYVLVTGWYDVATSMTVKLKGPQNSDTLSVGFGDI